MSSVLVTGFEPFGGESVNPTQLMVQRLAREAAAGVSLSTAVLPVDRSAAAAALFAAVETAAPAWVVMLGEAGSRTCATPERIAINVDDFRIPDNAGNQPGDEPVVPGGPAAYFSTLPIAHLVNALSSRGVPAEISNSAGTYLCNHVFYALMHRIEEEGLPIRAGFVHVPYVHEQAVGRRPPVPSLSLDTLGLAGRCILETLRDTPGP